MTVSEILFGFIYVTEGQRFTSAGLANYGAGSDWDQPWQLFRENAEYQLGLHDVGIYATKSWANKEKAALLRGGYNRVMITYIDQTGFCFEPLGEERFDPELGRSEGSLGMDEKETELCDELHRALHMQEADDVPIHGWRSLTTGEHHLNVVGLKPRSMPAMPDHSRLAIVYQSRMAWSSCPSLAASIST